MLIEAAWSYRLSARISRAHLIRQEKLAKPVPDVAWKEQERLCRRYRQVCLGGKSPAVITAASWTLDRGSSATHHRSGR